MGGDGWGGDGWGGDGGLIHRTLERGQGESKKSWVTGAKKSRERGGRGRAEWKLEEGRGAGGGGERLR